MSVESEGTTVVIRRLWPRTRRAWSFVALFALTFLALDVLSLMGSEVALKLLISLAGMLLGMALAYAATYPFEARFRNLGVWRMLGVFLGLALVFGIIFAGTALAGIPAFPTAEGGNVGFLIYGFAFGFGAYVPKGLGFSGDYAAPDGRSGSGRPALRATAIAAGIAAALFALLFAAFVLIEYVLAPLIRYFAG